MVQMIEAGVEQRVEIEIGLKVDIYCIFKNFQTKWYPYKKCLKMMWSLDEDRIKKIGLHRLCLKLPKKLAMINRNNSLKQGVIPMTSFLCSYSLFMQYYYYRNKGISVKLKFKNQNRGFFPHFFIESRQTICKELKKNKKWFLLLKIQYLLISE